MQQVDSVIRILQWYLWEILAVYQASEETVIEYADFGKPCLKPKLLYCKQTSMCLPGFKKEIFLRADLQSLMT